MGWERVNAGENQHALLHPAIDRGMVNRDAVFSHHRFEIAVTGRVPAVSAHGPEGSVTNLTKACGGRAEWGVAS